MPFQQTGLKLNWKSRNTHQYLPLCVLANTQFSSKLKTFIEKDEKSELDGAQQQTERLSFSEKMIVKKIDADANIWSVGCNQIGSEADNYQELFLFDAKTGNFCVRKENNYITMTEENTPFLCVETSESLHLLERLDFDKQIRFLIDYKKIKLYSITHDFADTRLVFFDYTGNSEKIKYESVKASDLNYRNEFVKAWRTEDIQDPYLVAVQYGKRTVLVCCNQHDDSRVNIKYTLLSNKDNRAGWRLRNNQTEESDSGGEIVTLETIKEYNIPTIDISAFPRIEKRWANLPTWLEKVLPAFIARKKFHSFTDIISKFHSFTDIISKEEFSMIEQVVNSHTEQPKQSKNQQNFSRRGLFAIILGAISIWMLGRITRHRSSFVGTELPKLTINHVASSSACRFASAAGLSFVKAIQARVIKPLQNVAKVFSR